MANDYILHSIKIVYGLEHDWKLYVIAEYTLDGFAYEMEVELDKSTTDNVNNIMALVAEQIDIMFEKLQSASIL